MRITSARILHARLNRLTNRVEAIVLLTADLAPDLADDRVRIAVSTPAHRDPSAAPLRHRLVAAAKLAYATAGRSAAARSAGPSRYAA
jgi:hypothetical protein